MIFSLIVLTLFGIAFLVQVQVQVQASIKKFSKCIDHINFATNSTATSNSSDEFVYY